MTLFAEAALLDDGWARNVAIDISNDGSIAHVARDVDEGDCERLGGVVIPAMSNLHSHSFQRALAGRTGRSRNTRGVASTDDSFWTWRQAMYRFLERVDADAFEAIAAQVYVEMAKAGYSAVAEFHYVYHDVNGAPYADPAELAWRIVSAAKVAGIALTLLPVFYAHSGFGGSPASASQRRFTHTLDTFARLHDRLHHARNQHGYVLGLAPHSLRAVTGEELTELVLRAPPDTPIHIHAAEQTAEVDACVAWSGMRPVEWLLQRADVDARWCLVHATHMTERETADLAASRAVAGLAPTTEADLGDGTFPGLAYMAANGRLGVGSDSNTIVDPFAELRQLEWSQRLSERKRNVLTRDGAISVGTSLWSAAAAGGAQAVGRRTGTIAAGHRADLLVLNTDDMALAEQAPDDMLDAAIFGPCTRPVRHVMVDGQWVVRGGRHPREAEVFARYRAVLCELAR